MMIFCNYFVFEFSISRRPNEKNLLSQWREREIRKRETMAISYFSLHPIYKMRMSISLFYFVSSCKYFSHFFLSLLVARLAFLFLELMLQITERLYDERSAWVPAATFLSRLFYLSAAVFFFCRGRFFSLSALAFKLLALCNN